MRFKKKNNWVNFMCLFYRGCEKFDILKYILIYEESKYVCDVCGKVFRYIKNKEFYFKR